LVDRAIAQRAPIQHRAVAQQKPVEACGIAPPAPETPQPPPAASPTIVDFVCEDDVRRAIVKEQKIFIGPKTIVTPAARDLASRHDTLVLAKR
jgi:hypothetical protein